jgi:hypothetical protein
MKYIERQKKIDVIIAQFEFVNWLVKEAKFKYSELEGKLRIDVKTIKSNLNSFIFEYIKPSYERLCKKADNNRLIICKEDRE